MNSTYAYSTTKALARTHTVRLRLRCGMLRQIYFMLYSQFACTRKISVDDADDDGIATAPFKQFAPSMHFAWMVLCMGPISNTEQLLLPDVVVVGGRVYCARSTNSAKNSAHILAKEKRDFSSRFFFLFS